MAPEEQQKLKIERERLLSKIPAIKADLEAIAGKMIEFANELRRDPEKIKVDNMSGNNMEVSGAAYRFRDIDAKRATDLLMDLRQCNRRIEQIERLLSPS